MENLTPIFPQARGEDNLEIHARCAWQGADLIPSVHFRPFVDAEARYGKRLTKNLSKSRQIWARAG
jgi:hypothetical protein